MGIKIDWHKIYRLGIRTKCAVLNLWRHKIGTLLLLVLAYFYLNACNEAAERLYDFESAGYRFREYGILIVAIALVVFFAGQAFQDLRCASKFRKAGFWNSLCETPILLHFHKKDYDLEYSFISSGLSIDYWENHVNELENILNLTISEIEIGGRPDIIIVRGYKGKYDFSQIIPWNENFLSRNPGALAIGDVLGITKYIHLSKTPHIIIGGATGSGKTVMVQLLAYQCIRKGYKVYISDFKGGVDYPWMMKETCSFLTEPDQTKHALIELCNAIECRKELLAESGYKDIDEYNYANPDNPIVRLVFICDEIAELLDKTGLSKEQKEKIIELEGYLNSIARLGRAFGIHLILATQRPDADVLPGQIKANMTYRLCGRSNEVLSRIILDNTDAAKLIPPNAVGIFVNQDSTRIKGYYMSDINMVNLKLYESCLDEYVK